MEMSDNQSEPVTGFLFEQLESLADEAQGLVDKANNLGIQMIYAMAAQDGVNVQLDVKVGGCGGNLAMAGLTEHLRLVVEKRMKRFVDSVFDGDDE
jgi:hypothetical protein